MNVVCPECRSVFRVDPDKVPAASVRARCSVCGGVITIARGAGAGREFAPTSVASAPAASAPAATRPTEAAPTAGQAAPPA
ncbi:MAG: zinc-ribbon domain-containing protein, partial [Gemmatimonadales bacterium]